MRFFVYFCRVHLESPVLQVLLDLKALRYELNFMFVHIVCQTTTLHKYKAISLSIAHSGHFL